MENITSNATAATIASLSDSSPVLAMIASVLPAVVMLVLAVSCIYIGSRLSVESTAESSDHIDQKAALRFPIMGSCVLFGLYMLYKYVPKEYLNLLLSTYFCALGAFAINQTVRPLLGHNIVTGLASLGTAAFHLATSHWITNNVLGVSFCITAIQMIPLSSVRVGALLLWLLFFYDIFWVFGTEVMVKVATSIDGPVKLVFPKDIFAEKFQFTLLGLGDIVLPGFYIALMYRMDHALKHARAPYFTTALLSYIAGLANTIAVMVVFEAAQPALLYLVPWTIGGTATCAALRGEFRVWWDYSEEPPKQPEDDEFEPMSNKDEFYNMVAELFGWTKIEPVPKKKDLDGADAEDKKTK